MNYRNLFFSIAFTGFSAFAMELPENQGSTQSALIFAAAAQHSHPSLICDEQISISDNETPVTTSAAKRIHGQSNLGVETTSSAKKAKTSDDNEKRFKCTFEGCSKVFAKKSTLTTHEHIHTGQKPCQCTFEGCNKAFADQSKLTNHQRTHTGEKPYQCTFEGCSKAFTDQSNLAKHQRTHTGEKPYHCTFEGCRQAFAIKIHLTNHERIHTVEKTYRCTFEGCTFSTAHKFSLTVHTRSHTKQDLLKCTFAGCTKTFTQKSHLTDHERIHSGEKPYQCTFEGCNKAFTQQSHLTIHERTHTGEKPYRCTFEGCSQAFRQASTLTRHLSNHNHDKSWWCDRCIYSTDTDRGLQKHITRSHTNPQQKPGTMLAGDHQDNSSQESLPELDEQDINLLEQNNPELSLLSPQPVRKNDLGDEFEQPLPLLDADQIQELATICPELNTPGPALPEEEPLPQTPMGANAWDNITENDITNLLFK